MNTVAYFKDIKKEIISRIKIAKSDIKVAVAWFTDEDIIRCLCQASNNNIKVKIVISNSFENFKNLKRLKELIKSEAEFFVSNSPFLHHKFCIIDDAIIINGSYNWSYAACRNEENIVVLEKEENNNADNRVMLQFKTKHDFLCNRCSVLINDTAKLKDYQCYGSITATVLSELEEHEIELRLEFENAVKASIAEAVSQNIPVGSNLHERMERDGGGVEFVKRIIYDEMSQGEMKPGFRRLAEVIPHRVDLSFEYLVSRNKYKSLFTEKEYNYCVALMKKYNLE